MGGAESSVFEIETAVKQGGMEPHLVLNMVLDFVIGNVLDETKAIGVKFAYGHVFHSSTSNQHKLMNVLDPAHADDLTVTCESMTT